MTFSEEEQVAFAEAAKPLIKWLNENCHPHTAVLVTPTRAELWEGVATFHTEEFVKG